MTVYLIHFDQPLHHAKHYMGYTDDLPKRMELHRSGKGARLMQVVKEKGITWRPVRVWWGGDRSLERRLKNCKNAARLCPICNPDGWASRASKIENVSSQRW